MIGFRKNFARKAVQTLFVLALGNCIVEGASATINRPEQATPFAGTLMLWGGGNVTASTLDRFLKASKAHTVGLLTKPQSSDITGHLAGNNDIAITHLEWGASGLTPKPQSPAATWIDVTALDIGQSALDQMLIDARFAQDPPPAELVNELTAHPGLIGIGIAPSTGLLIEGRHLRVVGDGSVSITLPASVSQPKERPVLVRKLHQGEEADLIADSLAAIARLGDAFPPADPPSPNVPDGSLFLCGGGELPDALWQHFIDLAGGPQASIVMLPTASPNVNDPAPKGLDRLKKLGCTHVTVLNQHTRAEVESPEFIAALKQARAIWFVGGRQWKYVDAYSGTVAEELFRDLLNRGGVIGGTSAGTAIQAQYLVRGDPLGNKDITAEGYERGFGFLPGTAIDIHVSQRGRHADLPALIHTFPQLLGLAIDEDTAIEVKGHTLQVFGDGELSIISPTAELTLKAGQRYDLANRKAIP